MNTKILKYLVVIAFVNLDCIIGRCIDGQRWVTFNSRPSQSYRLIICSYNNVASIDQSNWYYYNAYKIIITSSNIVYFSSKTIDVKYPIIYLKIENSSLSTIEKGAFSAYSDLQEIHFPQNNFTTIQSGVIFGLYYLSVLNFTQNRIESIENNAFMFLKELTVIDLSQNRLKVIATNFTEDLDTVETANFSFNLITTLEIDNFDHCSKLVTLDLSHNLIDALEVGYFVNLKSLQHLNISHNFIKTLEMGKFISLASLEFLDLSYNQIKTIKLTKLKMINIDNNVQNCSTLSEIIEQFRSLHIEVVYGSTEKLHGLNGITCHDDAKTLQANTQTQHFTTADESRLSEPMPNLLESNRKLLKETVQEMFNTTKEMFDIIRLLKNVVENIKDVQVEESKHLQKEIFHSTSNDNLLKVLINSNKTENFNVAMILILLCLLALVILLAIITFSKSNIFKDLNLFQRGRNTEEQITL